MVLVGLPNSWMDGTVEPGKNLLETLSLVQLRGHTGKSSAWPENGGLVI